MIQFAAAQHLALRIVKRRFIRSHQTRFRRFGPAANLAELKQLLSLTQQADRFKQGATQEALNLVSDLPWPEGIPVWEEAAWTVQECSVERTRRLRSSKEWQ
jgi:hypothetical protein